MYNSSDEELVADYLRGENDSLNLLIKRYLKPIFGFVYRYVNNRETAEDIVQEIFIKTWKNLKKFNRKKSFKIWLFAIAKNTAFDFLKKKKPISFSTLQEKEEDGDFLETFVDPGPLPEEIFRHKEIFEILEKALNQISPNDRAIILLHYNENLSFQEIAEVFNEPINTVKSRHFRALIKLKNILSAPNTIS